MTRSFDLITRNGRIIDGAGNPWYRGDIGITNGKISCIGRIDASAQGKVIDAEGLTVCPGFIDMHGHSDGQIFRFPSAWNIVEQGITTEVGGMCGVTPAPVSAKYLDQLAKYAGIASEDEIKKQWGEFTSFDRFLGGMSELPLGTNMAAYVGHGTIRIAVMGFENRPATEAEMEEMKGYVREAMESGAVGLSSGLIYPPGVYTPTEELVELSKVVAEYCGSYCSHIRNESYDGVNAIKEAIQIGRESGTSVIISHHKIAGKQNWGLSVETLKVIEEANKEGIPVGLDQYPYKAGGTGLKATIPGKYHEGGTHKLIERLRDPAIRTQIKKEILTPDGEWENLALNCGPEEILVSARNIPSANGCSVAEWAEQNNMEPFDALHRRRLRQGYPIISVV